MVSSAACFQDYEIHYHKYDTSEAYLNEKLLLDNDPVDGTFIEVRREPVMHPLEVGKTPASTVEGAWLDEIFTSPITILINCVENWDYFMHMVPLPHPLEVNRHFIPPGVDPEYRFHIGPTGNFFSMVQFMVT